MNRRSFLLSLGAATLGQGLMGCRRSPSALLQVTLLSRSLPSQLVSQFQSQVKSDTALKVSLATSPGQLFTTLQSAIAQTVPPRSTNFWDGISHLMWGDPPKDIYPLSSLGDYWLQTAIQQNLIRPWALEQAQGWQTLPQPWQTLVRRDRQGQLSATGELWGAPYRWGATVMAYRKSQFRELGWTPQDWSDLWRPELNGKLSLPNQPREVIGLTLKKLGRSYNTVNLKDVPHLQSTLQTLDRQVKFYSSTDYLQPLLLKDTWVAVGWSTDILPLLDSESDIAVVVPSSGTALWSDIWVWPQRGPSTAQVCRQWVEFWWQPEIAQALSRFTDAVSPVLSDLSLSSPSATLLRRNQPWFTHSEFLEPLPTATLQQYQATWQQMRT